MSRPSRLTPGLLAGTGAGLVWGLAFLVPVLLPGWSAVAVTAGRYLAYGILSLALLAYEGRAAWRLARQHWRAALAFAVAGNAGYYLLLVIGIQKIGAPVTDTIIGSIPVVVAVVSNWRAPALPWRRLALPVALSLAGLALINAVEFTGTHPSAAAALGARLIGLAAAAAAVALWTWYALANARFLAARPGIAAGSWSSVVGLATLVVTLAALLPVTLLGHTSWPAVSRRDAAMFLAGVALLGVAVSWGGTWLWNTASARLPTTTAGLLINVETVSGYVYVYLVRHQWPPLGQLLGFALILAGVSLALTRRQMPKPTRQHRPPDRKPEPPDGLIPVPGRDPAAGPYAPTASQGAQGTGSGLLSNTSAWHRDQREAGGTAAHGQTITSLPQGHPQLADLRSVATSRSVTDRPPTRRSPANGGGWLRSVIGRLRQGALKSRCAAAG